MKLNIDKIKTLSDQHDLLVKNSSHAPAYFIESTLILQSALALNEDGTSRLDPEVLTIRVRHDANHHCKTLIWRKRDREAMIMRELSDLLLDFAKQKMRSSITDTIASAVRTLVTASYIHGQLNPPGPDEPRMTEETALKLKMEAWSKVCGLLCVTMKGNDET